jgi:phosphatidylethanolamine/phosphatidyl-N-methylethanolamine N-methyltransferase
MLTLLGSSQTTTRRAMQSSLESSFNRWRSGASRNWVFFRQWLRAPLTTASVVPSSPRLGRAMAMALPAAVGRVVELGAGTGAITRELLRYRVRPEHLFVLELNEELHDDLAQAFPLSTVVCGDARQLPQLLSAHAGFRDGSVDAVVSSLGFLSMPPSLVEEILEASFACLPDDGVLIQFTYGPKCPIRASILRRLGVVARRVDFTLMNLPPASVYELRRSPVGN